MSTRNLFSRHHSSPIGSRKTHFDSLRLRYGSAKWNFEISSYHYYSIPSCQFKTGSDFLKSLFRKNLCLQLKDKRSLEKKNEFRKIQLSSILENVKIFYKYIQLQIFRIGFLFVHPMVEGENFYGLFIASNKVPLHRSSTNKYIGLCVCLFIEQNKYCGISIK